MLASFYFSWKKIPSQTVSVQFVYDNERSTRKQKKSEYIESAIESVLVVQPEKERVSFKKE